MALAIVQTKNGQTTQNNTLAVTFDSPTTAGNLIVAQIMATGLAGGTTDGTSLSSCTDGTNTYSIGHAYKQQSGSNAEHIWQRYTANAASISTVTVVGINAGGEDPLSMRMTIFEISGAATSSPFDKSSTGEGSGTAIDSGATAVLSQADEIGIGGAQAGGTAITFTPGTGWTETRDANNATTGHKIVAATTAIKFDPTGSASRDWVAGIGTFKAAAASSSSSSCRSSSSSSSSSSCRSSSSSSSCRSSSSSSSCSSSSSSCRSSSSSSSSNSSSSSSCRSSSSSSSSCSSSSSSSNSSSSSSSSSVSSSSSSCRSSSSSCSSSSCSSSSSSNSSSCSSSSCSSSSCSSSSSSNSSSSCSSSCSSSSCSSSSSSKSSSSSSSSQSESSSSCSSSCSSSSSLSSYTRRDKITIRQVETLLGGRIHGRSISYQGKWSKGGR